MISSTYIEGDSLVHKADPRLKLILLLSWVVALILPSPLFTISAYYLALVLLISLSRRFSDALLPLKSIWPILLLVFILTPPFHREGELLFSIGGWLQITAGGLTEAFTLIIRFSGITSAFFLFFRTTTIDCFILSLQWFGMPYTAALVITIAFRYIPSLIQLYRNIQDAHALRRPPQTQKSAFNLKKKAAHLFPTLVSVMIHSIKSIPALSMALEIRGFGRHNSRTSYMSLPASRSMIRQLPGFFVVLLILILLYFL